jgi:hypothetical protein
MSGKLKIKALGGGSLTLKVDDALATDEEMNISNGGIESGSNVNGSWIKYPDGTLICRFIDPVISNVNIVAGSVFRSAPKTYTFPMAFVGVPNFSYSSGNASIGWGSATTLNSTSVEIYSLGYTSAATQYMGYIAIGRWK